MFPPYCPTQPVYNPYIRYIGAICWYISRILSQKYQTFFFEIEDSTCFNRFLRKFHRNQASGVGIASNGGESFCESPKKLPDHSGIGI